MQPRSRKWTGAFAALEALVQAVLPGGRARASAANPAFERLFPGSLDSIRRLILAGKDKSALRVVNNLRELRSFDRLIWLHLG